MRFCNLLLFTLSVICSVPGLATTFYLDADADAGGSGTTPQDAWATLAQASAASFQPGDQILLQAGDTFVGKLVLSDVSGTEASPIVVASYGAGARPVINASGYLAGVHVRNSQYIEVRDLEITGDGGVMVDGSPEGRRYGVYLNQTGSDSINFITIDNLYIHGIYPSVGTESEGATPTSHFGFGIGIDGGDLTRSNNLVVKNCQIERVGYKAIEMKRASFVSILDNRMKDIGGPALQPSRVNDLVVRGNVVDGSGSFIDPRMHGRGSGIWPWTCERVLIEKNIFMGARGRGDSCGIHIDFNCRDVVVQYNLSIDNAGGFVEILGNNYNCTYRYNISINDGARTLGVLDQGTIPNNQNGNILWTSGYVGGSPRTGPFNNYIYNNTIYVKSEILGRFNFPDTTEGLLIANNIFYVEGPTANVTNSSWRNYTQDEIDRFIWKNNLYQRVGVIPAGFPFAESAPIVADPEFANAGGLDPEDYIPQAEAVIVDQGILIEAIPGDTIGLKVGFTVAEDFFGNPIIGLPDMGAVELGGTPIPLPPAAFAAPLASSEPGAVGMSAVPGPPLTEYFFTETTGNFGGTDSGWQSSPAYVDDGLLPNTAYAYTVTLRDAADLAGDPSATAIFLTPEVNPMAESVLITDEFSSPSSVSNLASPFPAGVWHTRNGESWTKEEQENSVEVTGDGALRTGWGYDEVVVYRYLDSPLAADRGYRFSGDWTIENVLDNHLGLIVGIGEFDPVSGEMLSRVKEQRIGELASPVIGQTGTFWLEISEAELTAAGITGSNRAGVFLHHDDEGVLFDDTDSSRNDVYLVDNIEFVQLAEVSDRDRDGIPDTVEVELELDPDLKADGSTDWDGDGWSNADEYLLGTNLKDSNDFLRVSIAVDSALPKILLENIGPIPGRWYILEYSQTLDEVSGWKALDAFLGDAVFPEIDSEFSVSADQANGFYRVRVERQ